jgi:hypothetical protein
VQAGRLCTGQVSHLLGERAVAEKGHGFASLPMPRMSAGGPLLGLLTQYTILMIHIAWGMHALMMSAQPYVTCQVHTLHQLCLLVR